MAANLGGGGSRIQLGTFNYETAADWVFYALTRNDDGVFTCYQGRTDGTLNWVSGEYAGFILKSGLPFCIAQDGTGNYGNKFVGSIDDAALWTRALRHDEVRRIYESGRAGTAIGGLLGAPAATAQWTGAGDVSDMADPDNWSCADGDGVPLAGAQRDAFVRQGLERTRRLEDRERLQNRPSREVPDAQRLQRRERRGERLHDHGLDGGHDEPRHP